MIMISTKPIFFKQKIGFFLSLLDQYKYLKIRIIFHWHRNK